MSALFRDSLVDREKRIDRMMLHFRHAEYLFLTSKPVGLPTPHELIWLLFQDAMHTVRNTPFTELQRVSNVRSLMPATRITDNDAFATELARLQSNLPQWDSKMVRTTVSAADVDRMVDVLDLVRLVEDRERDRLRRVVLARASGLSIQQCGRIWDKHRIGFDRRAMNDLQQRFIGQILVGLDKHFGLVRTSRGFRRLTVREIERRARANKRRAEEAEPARAA
jgi:hypothetical protein